MLRIAKIISPTTVEGPFTRMAVWVSGCTLRCPGCCNPELFEPSAGTPTSIDALARRLDAQAPSIEGITVLGGEPLQQDVGVLALLKAARARNLGTLLFTGYTHEQAQAQPGFADVWHNLDTLIDGPFIARQASPRRFIGSCNQRVHHRTSRYADPALWGGPRQIEAHISRDGQLEAHGLPQPVHRLTAALLGMTR